MRVLVPEVVQTSNMDCGPASLKCLLAGFGVPVSYGRLREACQTSVDGTSIEVLEKIANQLGLDAEQVMIPADHLPLKAAGALPALVVVRLASGLTHFVVAWSVLGGVVQVMDPGTGRRWPSWSRFLSELYIHTTAVPAAAWREYAASGEFASPLKQRMNRIGAAARAIEEFLSGAITDSSWRGFASLDASIRLTTRLVESRAIKPGREAESLIRRFAQHPEQIPACDWSVRPADAVEDEEHVLMRGVVLLRVRGRKPAAIESLSPELAGALNEPPARPARELIRLVLESGWVTPAVLLPILAAAACATIFEAVLFRGLFDVAGFLGLRGQRMGAITAVLCFSGALLLLEIGAFRAVVRLGRHLENRLRVAFLRKVPRLGDSYFQSRLISDMALRSHSIYRLRAVTDLTRQLLQSTCEFTATAAGILWLRPDAWPILVLVLAAGFLPHLLAHPALAERDLKVRTHAAALTRFHLDALLGLVAVRALGAAASLRREHETLLGEWAASSAGLLRLIVSAQAIQSFAIFGLVIWLLATHFPQGADVGKILLVVSWALNLPSVGQDIGALIRQYPFYRNLTLRLIDPLGAPEEPEPLADAGVSEAVGIEFREVSVEAGGHTILRDISLRIEPGQHVAIVGPSGAGKSTLAGVLLGWMKPKEGEVLIDGAPLDASALRQRIAWVDPSVQLWNRSLFENLAYGGRADHGMFGEVIDAALLRNVLENLPEGLQTKLGEGGALVSGGEGQRVRFGRALLRDDVRLVILDEPFRGLDREKRKELVVRAREAWAGCTLICVTHDLDMTLEFDRVVVVESGSIVENTDPRTLAAQQDSRYRQLLDAELAMRRQAWGGEQWRRVRVHAGRIIDDGGDDGDPSAGYDETPAEESGQRV